jgi:hypothetical protein
MARIAALKRALAGAALAATLTACSAAPAASPAPVASATAEASVAAATPSPIASATSAAPTDPPAPSTSPKPRPSIDQADLDAFLTASITLVDLADDDVAVTVAYLDPDSGEPFDLGTYTLAPLDQQTNQVPPGVYRLEFRQPASTTTGSMCTIELGDAEAYTFAAIDGAVAIARSGEAPTDAKELFVATSSLCGA